MRRFIAIFSSNPPHTFLIAQRLSPRIEICSPDGLLLEVTARSERKALKTFLEQAEGPPKTGIASTRITAILAAHTRSGTVVPDGKELDYLASLPVGGLSLILQEPDSKLLSTLFQWGIRTLGDLTALPEKDLVARLGQKGSHLQKMARGEDVQLFQSYVEAPQFKESRELEWTLDSLESFTFILNGILERLCTRLHNYGQAADSLHLILQLDDHTVHERTLRLASPMRHPKILLSLLRLDLQSHPPHSGIVGISLQAIPARPRLIQNSLLELSSSNPEKLSRTLARLTTLLGEENVGTPALLDTHRPDAIYMNPLQVESARCSRKEKSTSASHPGKKKGALRESDDPIPLTLRRFRPPLPTQLSTHQIVACSGPWRASGDWWRGTAHAWSREEWDVELTDGSIRRIYWDLLKKLWVLEGIYD
jgi:protein ImuB